MLIIMDCVESDAKEDEFKMEAASVYALADHTAKIKGPLWASI